MTRQSSDTTQTEGRVIIIGGGASGVLAATRLLLADKAPREVVLIERSSEIGRGIAYSAVHDEHVLNVPAGRMSAFPEQPDHFTKWLALHGSESDPNSYPPRALYGRYLEGVLAEASARTGSSRLVRLEADASSMSVTEGFVEVVAGADRIVAAAAILALGNLPSRSPFPIAERHTRLVVDPWQAGVLDNIGVTDDVIIAGTGLTMIDIVLLLTARGHRGTMHAISRRGLVPHAHPPSRKQWNFSIDGGESGAIPLRTLLRHVRAQAAEAATTGASWHDVMDTLRPVVAGIWLRLVPSDRTRFLRHVRPYWDIHRHRMAPAVAERFDALRTSGHVRISAGRIAQAAASPDGVTVEVVERLNGTLSRRSAAWAINATGPSSEWTADHSPLVRSLIDSGSARLDPLGLGLDATPEGVLLDEHGNPQSRVRLIGPPLRGVLWESTAIPDIREQALRLALAWPFA